MGSAHGEGNLERLRRVPTAYARYALLLPLILAHLVVLGFEDQYLPMKHLSNWLAAFVLVLTLYISRVGRKYFLTVAFLALASAAAWKAAPAHIGWGHVVLTVTFGALMVLAPVAIFRHVWKEFAAEGVDSEVVFGVLCAYLYIGSWYAFLYRAAAVLSGRPFFAQPGAEDGLNYVYFSFITLATVGYGDLTPAYGPGRMLAATEAIVGQLYLVSVVALVVSAYGKRHAPPGGR
jgi:hypothetical protein